MFCNAINKHRINVLFSGGYLYFHMGKIGIMLFPAIDKGSFYFPLALVPDLCSWNPSAMEEECAFCGMAT